jgi:hypothetical protein
MTTLRTLLGRKTRKLALAAVAVTTVMVSATHASTYRYTCKKGDIRYVLTVNEDRNGRGTIRLIRRSPTVPIITFRILGQGDCGKYGWQLDNDATFCTATQGVGTLNWGAEEYDCDQAD